MDLSYCLLSLWSNSANSMSQGSHQGIYSGFNRSSTSSHEQYSRRDKLTSLQGYDSIEEYTGIYEPPGAAANMLSEMFSYSMPEPATVTSLAGDYYGSKRQGLVLGTASTNLSSLVKHHDLMEGLNSDSAAAMQLFLMNPNPRSFTPTPSLHQHQPFGDPGSTVMVEGERLSLSLSSSLQPEDLGVRDGVVLCFNNGDQQQTVHGHSQQISSMVVLRSSRYSMAAQELLEEFCSVGRGKQLKASRQRTDLTNPNSSSSKDLSLSPAERVEYQKKKTKLLSMHDEVERRYNHYSNKMQTVMNSLDSVLGFEAATPYTALAQKAMSRHFRCLKDAVAAQLRQICEVLGENGGNSSGITKGETPRLRVLDQTLRKQRSFNQMGVMDHETWRPQRGLPERSVTALRAWLFEHFLHPYPSDSDKLLLARRTGLSRSQISNWFINARVRLWKPMVEEMYQKEAIEAAEEDGQSDQTTYSPNQPQGTNAPESGGHIQDNVNTPDLYGMEMHREFEEESYQHSTIPIPRDYGRPAAAQISSGATGDVSLTLGLRHEGNAQGRSPFNVRDFGGC